MDKQIELKKKNNQDYHDKILSRIIKDEKTTNIEISHSGNDFDDDDHYQHLHVSVDKILDLISIFHAYY